jgi:hypothetical protein
MLNRFSFSSFFLTWIHEYMYLCPQNSFGVAAELEDLQIPGEHLRLRGSPHAVYLLP